jgi:hypothetical protein
MNEGQLSNEVLETVSQGGSSAQLSAGTMEVLTQTATESRAEFSALVIEVMEFVPRSRATLTPVMN